MSVNIVIVVSVFIWLMSPGAFADTKSDLESGIHACAKITKDQQRLTCFDALAQTSVTPSSAAKVNNGSLPDVEQVKLADPSVIDDFSKEHLKKTPKEKGPESITATISQVSQLIRGQWLIYLENGQKWQQKDTGKIKLQVGDKVRLKKGSMGAVYLFKADGHRSIRVKRLK